VIIPLFIKIHRSRAIHRHKYNESIKMKPLSNETVSKKSNDIVRLYRPPSLDEMVTEGKYFSMETGGKYLSLPNELSSEIMRYLDYYYLHLLILVNKSFYNVLNRSRSLENGHTILVYGHERIESVLLKGLYEWNEAFLNKHKATCHRGHIPLCSMIICCTEWPDIDPRKLHLLSVVDPHTCKTLAFQTFWCGNITGFDYILFNNEVLRNNPLFEHTDLTSYRVLSWRKPASEDEDEDEPLDALNPLSYDFPFFFKFSLEEHGFLEITVVQLERGFMCIDILPEFNVLPESLCSTNTLGIPMIQFSVILRIEQCKKSYLFVSSR
jgi:hypothetical protein